MPNHTLEIWRRRSVRSFPWTRTLSTLLLSALLLGLYADRALAYRPPDPGDKLYAYGINEAEPALGRQRQNVGLLDIFLTNIGVIGNAGFVSMEAGASWRGGEYLYSAAPWIGAIAGDNLAYVSTGAYENELLPSLERVDHIYRAHEGIEHGDRQGLSVAPDDDVDGSLDEDPLNGEDDDGDGLIDEDYAAISTQMFSCEYWDYTAEARARYAEHRPLNVKIRQQSYAWASEGANEFVGFDFTIRNDGFELLRQVYLGFFVDSDVGSTINPHYYTDDAGAYHATDTTFVDPAITYTCLQAVSGEVNNCAERTVPLELCYMYDVPDDGQTARGGDAPGYFGVLLLDQTTDPSGARAPAAAQVHTARFFNGAGSYPAGDPVNDTQRYDLLQAGTKPTQPAVEPDDYRYCLSFGPYPELAPGEDLRLRIAMVAGEGRQGMLTNALSARRIYDGEWMDVDGDPGGQGDLRTGIRGRETCLHALQVGEPLIWEDPCDTLNPATRTVTDTACLPENYVDNDCDCCTPRFRTQSEAESGRGLETLVRWVGPVEAIPPAPFSLLQPANAESLLTTQPTLSWEVAQGTNAGGAVRYVVYWSMDSLFGAADSVDAGPYTAYLFDSSALLGGSRYYWKVRAVDARGLMRWSDPPAGYRFYTPLITPAGLTLQAQTSDAGILLRWSIPADLHALSYTVYRRVVGSEEWLCIVSLLFSEGISGEYVDQDAEPGVVYEYEIEVVGPSGPEGRWGPASAALRPVPLWLGLSPNPGRHDLTVDFGLPQAGPVTLRLFNTAGREISRQVVLDLRAGSHSVNWVPRDERLPHVSSGAYWVRLDTPAGSRTARWIVIR